MIIVRPLKGGFRCDMCFLVPEYQICGDDRYAEGPAFTLHLCKAHAAQLAKSIEEAIAVRGDEHDL